MPQLVPGSRLGRYQVQEEIGRGGCAYVFRGIDAELKRDVALKVLPSYHGDDPTFGARFKQEGQAVARLSHPNILPVYDFGEDNGFTYIVTKHVVGGTLHSRMGREHSLDEVLSYATPLASALDYAHRQGIVHRDFKPTNVLLDPEAGPILADFGIARILESSVHLTRPGWILGTPQYMSPEQALGRTADHLSDIYSFAIVLYELLLARPPFKAETPVATLLAQVHEPVPSPRSIDPQVDAHLESVLLKALAKSPDDRYQTAGDLVQAMATLSSGPEIETAHAGEEKSSAIVTAGRELSTPSDKMPRDLVAPPHAVKSPSYRCSWLKIIKYCWKGFGSSLARIHRRRASG